MFGSKASVVSKMGNYVEGFKPRTPRAGGWELQNQLCGADTEPGISNGRSVTTTALAKIVTGRFIPCRQSDGGGWFDCTAFGQLYPEIVCSITRGNAASGHAPTNRIVNQGVRIRHAELLLNALPISLNRLPAQPELACDAERVLAIAQQ
jgi:hypothetical protein